MMLERWAPAMDAKLRALWATGIPASQIATKMHKTRNSVIGRAHRLKLARRRNPGNRAPRPVREPRVKRVVVMKPRPVKNVESANIKGNSPHPLPSIPTARNLGLMDLTDAACRFPIGDGPYTFCGHETKPGSPYCEGHHTLCYQPADERRSSGYVNYTVRHAA